MHRELTAREVMKLHLHVLAYADGQARVDPIPSHQLVRRPSEDSGARVPVNERNRPIESDCQQNDFGRVKITLRPVALET